MTLMIPSINAISVPGLSRAKMSAFDAVLEYLGSATIHFAPLSCAIKKCCIATGCASAAFEPRKNRHLLCLMSLTLFVSAPKPQVFASPCTVVEWQIRAWWSTLFVPQKAANFRYI